MFWNMAMGLELSTIELMNIFNECLDYPLPPSEMEGLKTQNFWNFINYLRYHSQIVTPGHSVPIATTPQENSLDSLSLTRNRRSRRRRAAMSLLVVPESTPEDTVPEPLLKMATTPEPSAILVATSKLLAIMDATPMFPVIMNVPLENTQAFQRHLGLIGNLADP